MNPDWKRYTKILPYLGVCGRGLVKIGGHWFRMSHSVWSCQTAINLLMLIWNQLFRTWLARWLGLCSPATQSRWPDSLPSLDAQHILSPPDSSATAAAREWVPCYHGGGYLLIFKLMMTRHQIEIRAWVQWQCSTNGQRRGTRKSINLKQQNKRWNKSTFESVSNPGNQGIHNRWCFLSWPIWLLNDLEGTSKVSVSCLKPLNT